MRNHPSEVLFNTGKKPLWAQMYLGHLVLSLPVSPLSLITEKNEQAFYYNGYLKDRYRLGASKVGRYV